MLFFYSPDRCCSGTGKSTTIYHVIDARVRKNVKVLVTSTRNQAVDAVTEKIHPLGVLVSPLLTRVADTHSYM